MDLLGTDPALSGGRQPVATSLKTPGSECTHAHCPHLFAAGWRLSIR
jgi:hypothetical protein